jgi:hypothetical protein
MSAVKVSVRLPPAEPIAPLPRPARRTYSSAAVVVVYFVLGAVAFWPVLPKMSQRLASANVDFAQSVWFIAWVPHAIAHGLNPFFTPSMFAPTGANLASNTASPLLGLISAPLAPAFGPVARANLLMILAMPLSATAAWVVLRKWSVWLPAAALGGLLYGFSSYMVGQSYGHVELAFLPLPPLIALTLASILQRRGSPRGTGIRLGLLVAAQYLISPEVLATTAILGIAAVAWAAGRYPARARPTARWMVRPVGTAAAVAAALLAYPIWMLVAGPQHVTGTTWPASNPFHNDLLSFVVPGPFQRVSFGMASLGRRLDAADLMEAGSYIGVPLLILAGILAWRSRHHFRTQLAVLLFSGSALLSLGPHLALDGKGTGVPLPFLLLDKIPLLDNILPGRMGFELNACLAAIIAFGLDDMRHVYALVPRNVFVPLGLARRRSRAFAALTLAVLVLTQLPQWPYPTAPAVVLPAVVRKAVPAGDPVAITYPYTLAFSDEAMLWQVGDSFDFRLLGGYAYHPGLRGAPTLGPSAMNPPALQEFLAAQEGVTVFGPPLPVGPQLVAATRIAVSTYDVRLVIVDRAAPGSGPVIDLFSETLGPPQRSTGDLFLWARGVNRHSPDRTRLPSTSHKGPSGIISDPGTERSQPGGSRFP